MATWKFEVDFGSGYQDITTSCKKPKKTQRLHKDLRPTVNSARFEVFEASTAQTFLATDQDMPCKITKDGSLWFVGIVRPTFSADVKANLHQFTVEVVDRSTYLRKTIDESFAWQSYKVCDPSNKSSSIIHQLLYKAGVSDSDLSLSLIDVTVDWYVVEQFEEREYRQEIHGLLFETGWVYDVKSDGTWELHDLFPDTVSGATIDNEDMYHGVITKKIEGRYEGVRTLWYPHKTLGDVVVFSDTSGGDEQYKCNIELGGDEWYPDGAGTEDVYSEYSISERDYELIRASDVTLDWEGINVNLDTFAADSTRALLKLQAEAGGGTITKLDMRGNALVVDKADRKRNVRRIVADTEKIRTYEAKYITSSTDADRLTNGLVEWYQYADYQYRFPTDIGLAVGDLREFSESVLGTSTDVRVLQVQEDEWGNQDVLAEGISAYTVTATEKEHTHKPAPKSETEHGSREAAYERWLERAEADYRENTPAECVALYVYPENGQDTEEYARIIEASKKRPNVRVYVIINPGDGPGPERDGLYVEAIAGLHRVGVKVLGYVATGYFGLETASKTEVEVKSDFDDWIDFYPELDGLFYDELPWIGTGYQECGLSGKDGSTETGLSATSTYYWKSNFRDQGWQEYSITTGSDTTYSAVIDLINTEYDNAGIDAEAALVDGDLRFRDYAYLWESKLLIDHGASGDDLFDNLTDFTDFDDAVWPQDALGVYKSWKEFCHRQYLYPVVANPGTHVPAHYFANDVADCIVIFEDDATPAESWFSEGTPQTDYPNYMRSALWYGPDTWYETIFRMFADYCGLVYINDWTTEPLHTWNQLADSYERQIAILDQIITEQNVGERVDPGTVRGEHVAERTLRERNMAPLAVANAQLGPQAVRVENLAVMAKSQVNNWSTSWQKVDWTNQESLAVQADPAIEGVKVGKLSTDGSEAWTSEAFEVDPDGVYELKAKVKLDADQGAMYWGVNALTEPGKQYNAGEDWEVFGAAENLLDVGYDWSDGAWSTSGVTGRELTTDTIDGYRLTKVTTDSDWASISQSVSLTGDTKKGVQVRMRRGTEKFNHVVLQDEDAGEQRANLRICWEVQRIEVEVGKRIEARWSEDGQDLYLRGQSNAVTAAHGHTFYVYGENGGTYWYGTAAMVEDTEHPTPFVDGSREARNAVYTFRLPERLTVELEFHPWFDYETGDTHRVLAWYVDATHRLDCYYYHANDTFQVYWVDGGTARTLDSGYFDNGVDHTALNQDLRMLISLDLSSGQQYGSRFVVVPQESGTVSEDSAWSGTPDELTSSIANLYIGHPKHADGVLSRFRVYDGLTREEIDAGSIEEANDDIDRAMAEKVVLWELPCRTRRVELPDVYHPGRIFDATDNLVTDPEDLSSGNWDRNNGATAELSDQYVRGHRLTKIAGTGTAYASVSQSITYSGTGARPLQLIIRYGSEDWTYFGVYDTTDSEFKIHGEVTFSTHEIYTWAGEIHDYEWIDDETLWISLIGTIAHTDSNVLHCYGNDETAGSTYTYYGAVQTQDNPYPSPFTPSSRSAPAASDLDYDFALPAQLTIDCELKSWFTYDVSNRKQLLRWQVDATHYLYIGYNVTPDKIQLYWTDGGSAQSLTSSQFDDGTSHTDLNQPLRLVISLDLSKAQTSGSRFIVIPQKSGPVSVDEAWSGAIEAKSSEYGTLSIGHDGAGADVADAEFIYVRIYEGAMYGYVNTGSIAQANETVDRALRGKTLLLEHEPGQLTWTESYDVDATTYARSRTTEEGGLAYNPMMYAEDTGLPTGYVWLKGYLVGADVDIADVPQTQNVSKIFKLSGRARYAQMRFLVWGNNGSAQTLSVFAPSATKSGSGKIVTENLIAGHVYTWEAQSPDYDEGVSGWIIADGGNVEFNAGVFRATVRAGGNQVEIGANGIVAANYDLETGSPSSGDRRVKVDDDEVKIQRFDGSTWNDKIVQRVSTLGHGEIIIRDIDGTATLEMDGNGDIQCTWIKPSQGHTASDKWRGSAAVTEDDVYQHYKDLVNNNYQPIMSGGFKAPGNDIVIAGWIERGTGPDRIIIQGFNVTTGDQEAFEFEKDEIIDTGMLTYLLSM